MTFEFSNVGEGKIGGKTKRSNKVIITIRKAQTKLTIVQTSHNKEEDTGH